jgi:hypothetical protein
MANKNKNSKHSSAKQNYYNYIKGEEPLKHTVIPQVSGDAKIHDYIKSTMSRNLWVVPFDQWKKHNKNNN